jgi:uncharacterized repeat protein (TIGR01451 family)
VVVVLAAASATSAAVGTVFTVDTVDGTTDGTCGGTSDCSFGDAIQAANANAGPDTIGFNLPPTAPPLITPATELPTITDPVEIDATTQPGFVDKPIIELRGDALGVTGRGLRLRAGGSVVRGLVINRFAAAQITLEAGNGNRIVGNYLGTDSTGAGAAGGVAGIHIFAGADHVIGGSAATDRNVISGNNNWGIFINRSQVAGKVTIQGNHIGTNADGDAPVSGLGVGVQSDFVAGPIIVGGDNPGEGNVISGNGKGLSLGGGSGHQVVGNVIGTDVTGEVGLPNGTGIETNGVSNLLIASNVVSGNRGRGVSLVEDSDTIVRGNMIGVGLDGLERVPNGFGGIGEGIALVSTTGVLIGGTTEADRNIISANGRDGIGFFTSGGHPSRNTIEGNLIGIGADGRPLGNGFAGIRCCGSPNNVGRNVIGGVSEGAGNVIAFNRFEGISVGTVFGTGPEASILGNSIHSNGGLGIDLKGSALIGPTQNDAGDADDGPNDAQNFPVVTGVTVGGGETLADVAFNSTPATDFRLEFFRNEACNQPTSDFSSPWFYGEGQTLVGTQEVTTDADGNWSGAVTLAGETSPTEVITATATQFTEPSVPLVGSTSEFSECLADLSITKPDDPDPVAIGAPLTYTIDVVNAGPAPATDVRATDTLPSGVTVTSITPSQGTCFQSGSTVTCLLGLIGRDGRARVTIVLNPGSTPRTITNTVRVSSELRDPDQSDNSASATTHVVSGATIVVAKETAPDGSPQTFSFSGAITAMLADGQSQDMTVAPGTHTVSELVPAGWDATAIRCEDPSGDSTGSAVPVGPGGTASATFRVIAGETATCTFTNTQRGSVTLKKTTNGVVDPTKDICFVLTGLTPALSEVGRCTFGDQDGVLEWRNLVPGQYKICEAPVPAGFTSFWKLDGEIVTPYNPDASRTPPEDLGTRCYDFFISAGQARAFEVDNSRPGGDPRTIGYWKNWNRCTGGNQAATADKNGGAAAGFFLVEDLLAQLVGPFLVTSCEQAVKLLSKQDQAGKNKASDAAYELGAQLLAARFNLAAGAETCTAVQQAVLDGQTLLGQITFSGAGDYLGTKSKDARRAQALSLAGTLDRYNNGNLC